MFSTSIEQTQRVLSQVREQIRQKENHVFLDASAYCQLATSRQHFVRYDQPDANLFGIRDVTTGRCYFVEKEKLFAAETLLDSATSSLQTV